MSKGVKKALGFIVAIAIPFAAPAIAASIGIAGWLGSAAVGAGLGAANAAITGGNVAQGALFGGLGAGFSAGLSGAPMIGTAAPNAASGVAGTAVTATGTPVAAPTAGLDVAAAAGQTAGTVATAAPTAAATNFLDAVMKVPSTLAASLNDPTKLADLTIKAAGMLTAGAMTEDPMAGVSAEERQLVEQRKQELLQAKAIDENLFNQQLALAKDVIDEAKQFNPQNFAMDQATAQQLRGAAAEQQAQQTYGQGREAALSAEQRRIGLATGRNMSNAFSSGFANAANIKSQQLQAGLNMLPRSAPSGAYGSMLDLYKPYRDRADAQQVGIQQAFGDFSTTMFPPTAPPKKQKGQQRQQGSDVPNSI